MSFPVNQEQMFKAGYSYSKWERCPACTLDVEVWTSPGKRTIAMEPMPSISSPAVRHYEQCNIAPKSVPPATPKVAMFGVNDPNHQLISVGWSNDTLVCQFKTAKWGYAGVPEAEFLKLRKVPYAYRIFTTNIKGKYPATKLE